MTRTDDHPHSPQDDRWASAAARPRTGSRLGAVVAVLAGFVAMAGVLAGVAVVFGPDLLGRGDDEIGSTADDPVVPDDVPDADGAVAAFVRAVEGGDLGSIAFVAGSPTAVSSFDELTAGLGSFSLQGREEPAAVLDPTSARATVRWEWSFGSDQGWATEGRVGLRLVDGRWLVDWQPSVLEPTLAVGDRLQHRRLEPSRAEILGRDGAVLVGQQAVVDVGVQPSRVEDLPALTARLAELLAIDGVELAARVEAAPADAFVAVTTLTRPEYDAIRDEIFPLPGTVFRESDRPAAIDSDFARALLGRSGEVTAEILDEVPGRFEPGDYVGVSGLQRTYNDVLAGLPGLEISVIRAGPAPGTAPTGTGLTTTSSVVEVEQPDILFTIPATVGQRVVTSIDPTVQRAAEAALGRTELTSALVAIEVSTGHVLAVANGPRGASVDLALTGQYPPGSIFKVVTGYALLRDALDADDPVDCPQTITIDGRTFANAENEVLGTVPFRSAFAHSCNTAFVGASREFGPETLNRAAADFGLGVDYALGPSAFAGHAPITTDAVDLAAAAFGQGRVLVSPLSAAVMAATAADGTYRSPQLVVSPSPGQPVAQALEPSAAASLRQLMREVVTDGTGRAVAGVDGPPVHGKTGTAEFGDEVPPRSHAWFVGFQGDLAFAVFVEAGEFGGSTAAPIAADFLQSLIASP